jgi:hypothetical protein
MRHSATTPTQHYKASVNIFFSMALYGFYIFLSFFFLYEKEIQSLNSCNYPAYDYFWPA